MDRSGNLRSDPDATVVGPSGVAGDALRSGDRVAQFRIEGLLGAGGMGEVYVAVDERLGRRVALKAVRGERRLDAGARDRFLREARLLSSLEHPHICRIYDYIESAGGQYIVLELLSGRPVSRAGAVRKRDRLRIAEEVASALVAAHASGVIHRDLKPDNVMVTDSGSAKILDFGIARAAGSDEESGSRGLSADAPAAESGAAVSLFETTDGGVIGTPLYMSPEQAAGRAATGASDMYAFGLLLQEMLTGAPPRDPSGSLVDILRVARAGGRRPLRGVGRRPAALIRRLTAASPSARPSAAETLARIRSLRRLPVRRAVWLASLAVVLAGSIGGTKYAVDLDRERTVAVAARTDAEDQIEFVLGELRERLASVGRLDILDSAADRIMQYYERRGVEELEERELVRYARGLLLVGEVQFELQDFEAAERALREQIRLLERVLRSRPDDGEAIKALGAGHFWLGYSAMLREDMARAKAEFVRYLELGNRLVALDDTSTDWLMEKAYAHTNLGAYHSALGELTEARRHFEASLVIKRRVADLEPEDPDRKEGLASGLAWLMDTRDVEGDLDGALATAREVVALRRTVLRIRPEHADSKVVLCFGLGRMGALETEAGHLEEASASLDAMLGHARELEALDPANPAYMRERGVAHQLRGQLMRLRGELGRAEAEFAASRRILEALAAASPENGEAALDLVRTVIAQMQLDLDRGDAQAALARATGIGPERLSTENATSNKARSALAGLELMRGLALESLGDTDGARAAYGTGAARLVDLEESARTVYLDGTMAELLIRLGRIEEARPIVVRLSGMGERWRWARLATLWEAAGGDPG